MSLSRRTYLSAITLAAAAAMLLPPVRAVFFDAGARWLYIFLLSLFTTSGLAPLAMRLALKVGAVDVPNERKVHAEPTPRLGGLAVAAGVLGAVMANSILLSGMTSVMAGGAMIVLVGYFDDKRGVSSTVRMIVQLAACGVVIASGKVLTLFAPHGVGYAANVALTVLWVVGITNAMNFFDGMDGLAAGLSGIIALFMGIVAFQTDQPALGWLSIAVLGACLGFLPYNFKARGRAEVFLGDSGSTFLGFVLACMAVKGNWAENNPVVSLSNPILIFGVLIYDMVHITVERFFTGKVHTVREWLDYVGRDHLHHRIAALLRSNRRSVLFIYLLSACLGISAMALRNADTLVAVLLLVQATAIVLIVTFLEVASRRR